MSTELSLKLAAAVDCMPAFPQSVQKILELTLDVNCSPKDLVQVIDKDPVATVKVLRVVNSAYYSLPKQITSINHAVVYRGFNTIKHLALSTAAIGMLPADNAAGFDCQKYLMHFLTTASIAKQLALRVSDADPMDCFIAGLLHDFGKVVFAQCMPVEFRKALDYSHWHAVPPQLALRDTDMIACVFAANQISKKIQFGFGDNVCVEELPPNIAKRLGGTLEEVMASLGDLAPMLDEARIFSKI